MVESTVKKYIPAKLQECTGFFGRNNDFETYLWYSGYVY